MNEYLYKHIICKPFLKTKLRIKYYFFVTFMLIE